MIGELISNMGHSSTAGFVGVSLIFVYLAWILFMAFSRIEEGKKEGHH
ncbi:hypothetical protein [Maridesulfovibrio zosterae]|nr:hypothetical protein [Maridesulfovibrio zosterae]